MESFNVKEFRLVIGQSQELTFKVFDNDCLDVIATLGVESVWVAEDLNIEAARQLYEFLGYVLKQNAVEVSCAENLDAD